MDNLDNIIKTEKYHNPVSISAVYNNQKFYQKFYVRTHHSWIVVVRHALVAKSYIVVHTVNNKVSNIVGFHEIDLYL